MQGGDQVAVRPTQRQRPRVRGLREPQSLGSCDSVWHFQEKGVQFHCVGVIVIATALEGTRVIVLRVAHHGSVWVQERPHNQPERFLLLVTLLLQCGAGKDAGQEDGDRCSYLSISSCSLPSGLNIVNFSPEKRILRWMRHRGAIIGIGLDHCVG